MQTKQKHNCFKRYSMALLMMLFIIGTAMAQVNITGVVVDNNNDPVIGATVQVLGTTVGTITDYDGNYSITAPSGATKVSYSFIGMTTQVLPVKAGIMNVKLVESSSELDEVVVIGYETAKKRDLTGSVSSVGAKAMADLPIASAAEALTGKLAGVQVTTTEGSPDAEVKIRVRGGGSITGDNSPLYLVDGFPVNSISDISPSDIQSIDVLKDASSTAIYGARGANGVIIITTKSPSKGKLSVSLNSSYAFKKISKTLDVLSPYEFALWQYEQALLQDKVTDQYINYFGHPDDMDLYKSVSGTNWQDETFGRTGQTWNNNVSLSGGSDKLSFNASYNRIDDKAIMVGSEYVRNNVNFKMNARPIDRLKVDFSTRYSDTNVLGSGANEVNEKSSTDSRLKHSVIYTPISLHDLTTTDSDIEEQVGNLYPPDVAVNDNYRQKKQYTFTVNGGVGFDIIKGLTLRSELGYEIGATEDNRYYGLSTYYVRNNTSIRDMPAIIMSDYSYGRLRNTNTLSYKPNLGKNHNLSILLGEETLTTKAKKLTTEVQGIPAVFSAEQAFQLTTQGTAISIDNYFIPDNKLLSFFGRASYDYKSRYLFSGTLRADGSSLFGPGNRWGLFPSASAAWRISEEAFMAGAQDWLSNLKLRLSYGSAGNNRIDPGLYMLNYESATTSYINIGTSYWRPVTDSNGNSVLANPDLKWETTYTRNLGLDFGFFNHRLSGTVDVYWNNTKDLLINFPITGSGYSTQIRNIGETSNKGLEFSLNGVMVDKKNFSLEASFNIAFNQNRVENLGGLEELVGSTNWTSSISDDYRVYVGQPIGLIYGYVTDGYYSTDDFTYTGGKWVLNEATSETPDNSAICAGYWGPGALKLKDLDGNGVIDANDRQVIGNTNPLFTGGFNLSARFYNFDLGANFTFVYGNDIYNANKIEFTSTDNNNYKYRNMTSEMVSTNRWTNIDPVTNQLTTDKDRLNEINAGKTLWSPATKYIVHSWAVEDGSYLRLNNLTLGYSLPERVLKAIHMQKIRLYATAYNLFVLTNYTGYDPEVDSRRKVPYTTGCDYSAYPKSTSFTFGVNITY